MFQQQWIRYNIKWLSQIFWLADPATFYAPLPRCVSSCPIDNHEKFRSFLWQWGLAGLSTLPCVLLFHTLSFLDSHVIVVTFPMLKICVLESQLLLSAGNCYVLSNLLWSEIQLPGVEPAVRWPMTMVTAKSNTQVSDLIEVNWLY